MNSKKLALYNLAIYAHNEIAALELENISVDIVLRHHNDDRSFNIMIYGNDIYKDLDSYEKMCYGYVADIDDGKIIEQHKESVLEIIEAIRTDDYSVVSDVMDMME